MPEETPLTSEEMIRRAREDLSKPPVERPLLDFEAGDEESTIDPHDDLTASAATDATPRPTISAQPPGRRPRRRETLERRRPPHAASVIVGLVTAGIGLVIALALFAATAP